jgi:hypothetical protein
VYVLGNEPPQSISIERASDAEVQAVRHMFAPPQLTAAKHRRDFRLIAEQHLANACAHSLCAPHDETWPKVIDKLSLWLDRLQGSDLHRGINRT